MIFKKKDVDTLIGKGAIIEGDVKSDASVRIDGEIRGNIRAAGDVTIGKGASVSGDVTADNLYISGIVEGSVQCSGFLRIFSEGVLKGDAKARSFAVDEGAFFDGKISMSGGDEPKNGMDVSEIDQQPHTK